MPRNPHCERCPLHKGVHTVCVWGVGKKSARIMLLGEAPGEAEDRTGEPFQGKAGRELDEALSVAGLTRADVYIANPVKCRPPGNRDPSEREIATCFPYLAEEIASVNPAVILCMGRFALFAMTGKKVIKDERGKPVEPARYARVGDAKIIATYHPAAYLNSGDKMMKAALAEDLQYAKLLAGMGESKLPVHVRSAVYPDGSVEAVDESGGRPVKTTLAALLSRMDKSAITEIAIDCEWSFKERKPSEKSSHMAWPWTPGAELYSIALSGRSSKGNVVSVGIAWPQPDNDATVKLLQKFLSTKRLDFHNSPADLIWLTAQGFDLVPSEDTQYLAYLINEEQRLNLERLCALVVGIDEWKVNLWKRRPETTKGWREMLLYNMGDTYGTLLLKDGLHVMVKQRDKAERRNIQKAYYKLLLPAVMPFVRAALRGVRIDVKKLDKLIEKRQTHRDALIPKVADGLGIPERAVIKTLNSHEALKELIHDRFALEVEDTQEKTLRPYRLQYPVLGDAAEIKHDEKALGTYYEPWRRLITRDRPPARPNAHHGLKMLRLTNRLRSVYRLDKTATGRLSANTEEGGSLLVVPRGEARTVIGARKGWSFGAADYSQIELRMIAWLAPEKRMRRLFNEGADLHSTTAAFMIAHKEHSLSVQDFWRQRSKWIKQVTKEQRQRAKGINFGFDFGMGEDKFAGYALENYDAVFTPEESHDAREGYFVLYDDLPDWHERMASDFYSGKNWCVTPTGRYRRNITSVTQMINSPIQMTANDFALIAAALVDEHFETEYSGVAEYIGYMHDAIMFECREDLEDEIRDAVKNIMENLPLHEFGIDDFPIPIVADVDIGKTWVKE